MGYSFMKLDFDSDKKYVVYAGNRGGGKLEFIRSQLNIRLRGIANIRRVERDMSEKFKEGELIIYVNGDRYEIGKIKRIVNDGAFVYYHSGDTASKTPFDKMHKLINGFCITGDILGGCNGE